MANMQWHNHVQRSLIPENFLLLYIGWASTDNLAANDATCYMLRAGMHNILARDYTQTILQSEG